jgi:hypothetical protein
MLVLCGHVEVRACLQHAAAWQGSLETPQGLALPMHGHMAGVHVPTDQSRPIRSRTH